MFESKAEKKKGSHHNLIYRNSASGFVFEQDAVTSFCKNGNAFLIPHHTGVNWCPHKGFTPEHDDIIPLIEIYSVHGQCEYYNPDHILAYEYNRVRGGLSWSFSVNAPAYARDAWAAGCRYGVIASSDNHAGQPGNPINGLAAVYADANTSEDVFHALKARRTYATTGERIIMDFKINGAPLGSEIRVARGKMLAIEIKIFGTGSISYVDLMKYDFDARRWEVVFHEQMPVLPGLKNLFGKIRFDTDRDYSKTMELPCTGNALYYVRAAQKTQYFNWPAYGWTSPIWVDAFDTPSLHPREKLP
jgi:hypothetical protein